MSVSSHPANDLPPVGSVVRPAAEGTLLVASDGAPVEPGTRCQTRDSKDAGVVEDVIGPVDEPFLVVSLPGKGPAPEELIGSRLYPR